MTKKRLKRANTYGRNKPSREERPLFLIVCEGKETEPRYFRALFRELRLPKPTIVGGDECGTAPISIVDHAATHCKDDNYAQVWCVFDRDEHLHIPDACQRARNLGNIEVAFSNPCIELWYLVHFRYSTASLNRHEAERELRGYLGMYTKSTDVYDQLRDKQDDAITHAKRLRQYHIEVNEGRPENPSTTVDVMVEAIRTLAKAVYEY